MATYPIRQLADNGGTAQFVPVTAPEAVQFPDGSNLNTLIGSVATIESNPVAANHAVGEFLCINGQVYEVIDAITAGDSIALGENVQVANLGSQITALNKGLTAIDFKTISVSTDSAGKATYSDARITTNSVIVLTRVSGGASSITFSVSRTIGAFTIYAYNTDTKAVMANASLTLLAAIKY